MSVFSMSGYVKIFAGVLVLSVALLFTTVYRYDQESIDVTFMEIWEMNKDTDSFKAGLRSKKPLEIASSY